MYGKKKRKRSVRVRGELVTLSQCTACELWKCGDTSSLVETVQEEGCAYAELGQSVEDLGCVDEWTVVEGEGDCAWDGAVKDHGWGDGNDRDAFLRGVDGWC